MVLNAWRGWRGSFSDFGKHVRRDLRLDFGDTTISSILSEHGARRPKRRPGPRTAV